MVDGAHVYQIVSADNTNCLRNLSISVVLSCDDASKKVDNSDKSYKSLAAFESLKAFTDEKKL